MAETVTRSAGVVRKVGTAKRTIRSANGREWEAEICLHSGTDPQAPRLMVIYRDPTRAQPDRYTLLPPDAPKTPKQAAAELSDDDLRALLKRSTALSAL